MTRMSASKLIAIGDNCLDVYLTKDLMTVGGNALNVAAQWRRQGWQARYLGAIGEDAEGDYLLEEVETAGLAGKDVERRRGDTAVTLLREEGGDRRFLLESLGVGENFLPAPVHGPAIAAADWVHLGTNSNLDLVRRLVRDRIPFSVDISTAHKSLPLEGVPLLFASGPDAPNAPVESIVKTFLTEGARQVVLTCGARGAYFHDGTTLLHGPAASVSVVDTCGAGDSFIATFLTCFCCERRSGAEALQKAAAAAAETCTHLGGFPQQPRRIPRWLLQKYAAYISPVES
jgi:fructoselysine 6-kinase